MFFQNICHDHHRRQHHHQHHCHVHRFFVTDVLINGPHVEHQSNRTTDVFSIFIFGGFWVSLTSSGVSFCPPNYGNWKVTENKCRQFFSNIKGIAVYIYIHVLSCTSSLPRPPSLFLSLVHANKAQDFCGLLTMLTQMCTQRCFFFFR